MFLFEYFYGSNKKEQKPCEQRQEEEWILVDNNLETKLNESTNDEYAFVEKDELTLEQDVIETPESKEAIINGNSDELTWKKVKKSKGKTFKNKKGKINEEDRNVGLENPISSSKTIDENDGNLGGIGILEDGEQAIQSTKSVQNQSILPTTSASIAIGSNGCLAINLNKIDGNNTASRLKNHCKKQVQRRADKYKSGIWSGRSNDRKCGKCY